mmetsp:Transcript_14581/g.28723  ORF Transcript_14581/g.28723 Transcript_14581/m.28723 type:complete len:248 (+) Transcript_14581:61-804(+)
MDLCQACGNRSIDAVIASADCQRQGNEKHCTTCCACTTSAAALKEPQDGPAGAVVFEDALLARTVLQNLDPLHCYETIALVCIHMKLACADERLWHAVLDRWPCCDVNIQDVRYVGRSLAGRHRVLHVQSVILANAQFYKHCASRKCSHEQADSLIAQDSSVIHPQSTCSHGQRALESWYHILCTFEDDIPLSCIRQRWRVDDNLAMVTCGEDYGSRVVEATNVYEHRQGVWQLVHHQSGEAHRIVR